MERIEKKHLKKMACPKCGKAKLRFKDATDGVRCDVCKHDIAATDAALNTEWKRVQAEDTPVPVVGQRY